MTYWIDENAKEQRTQCNHIKYADVANNANNSSNNVCKGTINNNGICCNLWHVAFLCNAFRFISETPSSKWRNKHVCVIYVCDGILFLRESNPLISDVCVCVFYKMHVYWSGCHKRKTTSFAIAPNLFFMRKKYVKINSACNG